MELIVISVVFITLAFIYLLRQRSSHRFPEGPKGWPIFGNTFQLKISEMVLHIAEMGKDYGNAYTVQFLDHKFVILNSYSFIKEVLTSKEYSAVFSGRPKTYLGMFCFKKDLVLQSFSSEWSSMRKFLLRCLKTHNTAITDAEMLVQQELKHLVCRIQNEAGRSVNPYSYVDNFSCSLILMLVSGQHYETGHPMLKLVDMINNDIDILVSPKANAILTSFPFLRRLPVGYGAVSQRLMTNFNMLMTTILSTPKENRKECIIDHVLEEKLAGNLDDENINGIVVDLIVAGSSTLRATLSSLMLILASRPEVQECIQKEINREVGTSHLPCVKDKHRMPYTRSVLMETLRLFTTSPLPVLHSTMSDVEVGKYRIPAGTEVFYNIWHVLHDESFWDNPWEFQPSRFLDTSGNFLPSEDEKRKRMLVFGLGKRKCIGESIAKMRLFLACATILQSFTIIPDPQCPLPETDPRTFHADVLLICPGYRVIFKRREDRDNPMDAVREVH